MTPEDISEGERLIMATILYIEDNLYNVQLVERLLLQRPHIQLLTSVQGNPGIGIAQIRHPDLILLDVHLPDINGFEVLERLRLDAATANIPIVVLSADATPGQVRRFRDAGANEYLTKPLDLKLLLTLIDNYLGQSDTTEEPATDRRLDPIHRRRYVDSITHVAAGPFDEWTELGSGLMA